jgi:hypothetical protein
MLPTKFRFIWSSGFREDLTNSSSQKQELPVAADNIILVTWAQCYYFKNNHERVIALFSSPCQRQCELLPSHNISATCISWMAISFSGGGSQSTRREPPTMGKHLVNYHLHLFFIHLFFYRLRIVRETPLLNYICFMLLNCYDACMYIFYRGPGWLDFWCFNATFNNISAISWRSVLVVEEARVPGENHRPWASNW